MKTQGLLLAGALGVSAFLAMGAVGYSYWAQSAPDAAPTMAVLAPARSARSRQFSREGDRLMGAAKADDAIRLARAFQKSDPKDGAGFEIEARVLAMNGDIAGAVKAAGAPSRSMPERRRGRAPQAAPVAGRTAGRSKTLSQTAVVSAFASARTKAPSDREFEALEKRAQTLLRAKNYGEIETDRGEVAGNARQISGRQLEIARLCARAVHRAGRRQRLESQQSTLVAMARAPPRNRGWPR